VSLQHGLCSLQLPFPQKTKNIANSLKWLPFDADAPAARVSACLQDSKACILICDTAHYGAALKATKNLAECRLLTFEELSRQAQAQGAHGATKELPGPRAHHTAYMIYTSGSTGTPKVSLTSYQSLVCARSKVRRYLGAALQIACFLELRF